MTFVVQALTQQNGEPKYTANDFRLTVSNFLTVGEKSSAFGAVQGLRATSFDAVISMAGSTITVRPHSGIIVPWTGVGAYAYAITSDITVPRPTTGDYYVVLTVEDPSQSHGSEPQGRVDLIPTSTPRVSINGLVIARTQGSAINQIATRLRNGTVIETVSKEELDFIKPVTRARGYVRSGEGVGEYEFNGRNWVPVNKLPDAFSLTYDGWHIDGKPVGDKLWNIHYLKTYSGSTQRFDAEIRVDLPISVPFTQNIAGNGNVSGSLVSDAYVSFEGRRGHIHFGGYSNSVSIDVQGIIYAN